MPGIAAPAAIRLSNRRAAAERPDPASRFQPRRRARTIRSRRSAHASPGPTRRGAASRPRRSSSTSCTSERSRREARSAASTRTSAGAARSRHHRDRADAGRGLRRRARNWGYDGVALFAPSRAYGRPDDLRALVDARARARPRGPPRRRLQPPRPRRRVSAAVQPAIPDDRASTPWGERGQPRRRRIRLVRRFIIDNAVHWIREYHLDGLRLDATHALIDARPRTSCASSPTAVRAGRRARRSSMHAEDSPKPERRSFGRGATAAGASTASGRTTSITSSGAWSPATATATTRITEGTREELARDDPAGLAVHRRALRAHARRARHGSVRVPMHRFVVCLQNHDQVGNRALGDRLHHRVDAGDVAGGQLAPAHGADDAAALHGPGMGRDDAVSVLHGSRASARAAGHRGPAATSSAAFPEFAGAGGGPHPRSAVAAARSRRADYDGRNATGPATPSRWRSIASCSRCGGTNAALQASDDAAGEAVALDDDTIADAQETRGAETMWIVVQAARQRRRGSVAGAGASGQEPDGVWQTVRRQRTPRSSRSRRRFGSSGRPADRKFDFQRPGGVIFRIAPPRRMIDHPAYVPVSTYRLQLHKDFPFAAAREIVRLPRAARRRRVLHVAVLHRRCRAAPTATTSSITTRSIRSSAAPRNTRRSSRGSRRTGSATSSTSCRTTWATPRRRTSGGATCSRTDRARRRRSSSTSTGRRSKPSCAQSCCCRFLGTSTGSVLERGELQLGFRDGALVLHYFDQELPINPRQAPRVYKTGRRRR